MNKSDTQPRDHNAPGRDRSALGARAKRIVPFLWFDDTAEEAARFYVSIFGNSSLGQIIRYSRAGQEVHGKSEGAVMTVEFELEGCGFLGLNGGPQFRFSPAISFYVTLETEAEVDLIWTALAEGGQVLMPLDRYDWSAKYGWLNDRYGVSWQISLGDRKDVGQAIVPSLLFVGPQHGRGEEAIQLYTSVFAGSTVEGILRYDGSGADPKGSIKHAQFYLGGETFMIMESAHPHEFEFTEAVSFVVRCKTQDEIDHFWNALSAVPEAEQCGWLKDRFGISWQIVPAVLTNLLADPDPEKSSRVMASLLGMKKLDIQALERAYAG